MRWRIVICSRSVMGKPEAPALPLAPGQLR
jgi:hypothetical protein